MIDTVAAAVEEQSVTTKDISGNVAQAVQGFQEVNQNVTHSSQASSSIASDIAEVNQTIGAVSDNSAKISGRAEDLSGLAGELVSMVSLFKIDRSGHSS